MTDVDDQEDHAGLVGVGTDEREHHEQWAQESGLDKVHAEKVTWKAWCTVKLSMDQVCSVGLDF